MAGAVTKAATETPANAYGQWVNLVGVFDAVTGTLSLYVNGVLAGEGTLATSWRGTGGLFIGSGTKNGAPAGHWQGGVDDVRMYNEVLSHEQISQLYHSYPLPGGVETPPEPAAGHWRLDENSGTVAADSSGRGLTATLSGQAGWHPSRTGVGLWLDGATGHAETAEPALDTGAPFSVTAWAYLTDRTRNATVVAQDGERVSSFLLQYNAQAAKWAVVVPTSDTDNPASVVLTSSEQAVQDEWTHLTVTYDPYQLTPQVRLYVNGALSAASVGTVVQPSAGVFTIGRGKWNGIETDHFPRGVDDVRAFPEVLSDNQVRRIHDDAPPVQFGYWRFDDGSARDSGWRQNHATVSGTATFGSGTVGRGLHLDGESAAAAASYGGVSTRDSFTVSAWAKLSSATRTATVLAQDGDRTSGFVLQYNADIGRWVFGVPTGDVDGAPMVYAYSPAPPSLNIWTHLTGVYDFAARRLRLYVNGLPAGTKDNVAMWPTTGGFTIGRGKTDGAAAGFFPGVIDEVTAELGIVSEPEVRLRAGWPPPAGGQLARFVNDAGDNYTASSAAHLSEPFSEVPAGYRFDRPLGLAMGAQREGTHRLYACAEGTDEFTSTDPRCEGTTKLADLGWIYTSKPADLPTVPLHRCQRGDDRFDTLREDCDGAGGTARLLGYSVGYATLTRYYNPAIWEHTETTLGTPPSYRFQYPIGLLALSDEPETRGLWGCQDGTDQFLSLEAACEGKTVLSEVGRLWTEPPPGLPSRPIHRCIRINGPSTGERFVSDQTDCDGHTFDRLLGHVLLAPPGPPLNPGAGSSASGSHAIR
jgi:hypothetical protein